MKMHQMITRSLLSLLGLLGLTLFASPTAAQVFDLGPSDPAFFDTVINLPDDPNIGEDQSVGGGDLLIQLNISNGGSIGDLFSANNRSEVNLSGGSVGEDFEANGGSEVNLNGGLIGRNFDANANSTVNVSRGSLSDFANANFGSTINISGGIVGFGFDAFSGSEVNISGGTFGRSFDVRLGSDVELIGGEFQLNGTVFSGTSVSLNSGDTFTGTLTDGSSFVFATEADDSLSSVQLTSVALPALDLAPIVVSTANPNLSSGLRPGQTMTLLDGGQLGFNFEVANATLDIEGGTLGTFAAAANSTVNISGGSVGSFFDALSGTVVNISGGSVDELFTANAGSVVNIRGGNIARGFEARGGSEINVFGTDFRLNGVPLGNLAIDDNLTVTNRNVELTGRLADGSVFRFELNSSLITGQDFFDPGATLTVTEVVLPVPPITHVPRFTFEISFAGGRAGFVTPNSVSGAGDVNGDGVPDLIVGAQHEVGNGDGIFFRGIVWVVSGVDGDVLYNFDDASPDTSLGDGFIGSSVSGAGDVNGDGFDDLILGITVGSGTSGSGIAGAKVISGFDGSVLYNFAQASTIDTSVGGAGDVNGDGFDDVIVARNGAQVFSGSDGSILYSFSGDTVSDAGDVNGDGFADLIVGDRTLFSNAPRSAQVYSGSDGSLLYDFGADPTFEPFGSAISGAGDVNGDGFDDLIVGGTSSINGSVARVYSGSDGSVLYDFDRGSPVSGAGDVDGDGFDDLIVGLGISALVYSGSDGRILYHLHSETFEGFGQSVSDVGDVNGDGLADFVVGAAGGGVENNGFARLFVSQIAGATILGDVDQDGAVTFADIPAFIEILQSGGFLAEADANQDGEVNFSDIAAFIEILTAA